VQHEAFMEADPTVIRLRNKLGRFFPELTRLKIMKADSSYTINKHKIYICTEYNGERYDDNMLTYVILHELAHVKTPEIGHGEKFMRTFQRLLKIAEINGLWDPNKPRVENYCKTA
jgi:predicted metal-dependent hydrolase